MIPLRIISPHAVSVRVILVQPRNPLNILAAARAARNFGLGDIAVVEVQERAWAEALEKDTDRETPHGPRATSRGWLGDACRFDSLLEAIGECDWVLGTSSLERRKVARREVIELPELAVRLAVACGLMPGEAASSPLTIRYSPLTAARAATLHPTPDTPHSGATPLTTRHAPLTQPARRRIAILFGSEKRGLANEHLMYCHHLLHIPTAEEKPSMNLGQAVAVVCYELARSGVLEATGLGTRDSELGTGKTGFGVRGSGFAESAVGSGHAEDAVGSDSSKASKVAADSNISGRSNSSGGSGVSAGSGSAAGSGCSKFSEAAGVSGAAEISEVTENTEEIWNAASAREKQALADHVAGVLRAGSAQNTTIVLETESDSKYRNLIKMITRLPLTSEDVRRIIKLIKGARTESSEGSKRPRMPRVPRKP